MVRFDLLSRAHLLVQKNMVKGLLVKLAWFLKLYKSKKCKFMAQHWRMIIKRIMGLLAVVSLLIVFRDVVFSLMDEIVVPITSKVKQDSVNVLICTILLVVSVYLANGILIHKKSYINHPERSWVILAIIVVFYSLFRFSNHYVYYGIYNLVYVDVAFVVIAVLELLSYIIPVTGKIRDKGDNYVCAFVLDNPSLADKLGRTDYAELLLDKICMTYRSGNLAEGSMTILLNERYGVGKTTFFNLITQKAKGRINTCVFKPWQTVNEGGITDELLRLLEEQYAISSGLGKQLESYSKLLSGNKVGNAIELILDFNNERDSLAQRYESIKEMLRTINVPLIVFVDDVDRLQTDELFALLKLLRNAADFPNIVYLVAADKEAISQMLKNKGIKDGDEYLKKFFNFELLFPRDDSFLTQLLSEQILGVLTNYYEVDPVISSIEKDFLSTQYVQNVFYNPRDVYRFVNLLTYMLDMFKQYGLLKEVYVPDLLKLMLIQYISPMAYKILRDEMGVLLDVRKSDGRVHLKSEYNNIIMSRQDKKMIRDMASRSKKRDATQEETNRNVDIQTLRDIPAIERPNKEDIVSELLRELFYDTQNFQKKSRICYIGEYFKFFAGKYSKSELSALYMRELMESPSETDFEDKVKQTIQQGKTDFLVHKLKQYIEDEKISKDIPVVLKRCIAIEDVIYRDWAQKRGFPTSPKDYCQLRQFSPVFSNLLLVGSENVVTDSAEIDRVRSLFAKNKQYAWLATSLLLPINEEYNMSFVYGQDIFNELKENLIRRFVTDELKVNPFEQEKIVVIPILKKLNITVWDNLFRVHIKNSLDPMAWLYILLEPYGDSLRWNRMICHNLVDTSQLDFYANDFLNIKLPLEISSDLAKLSVQSNIESLSKHDFEQHPFLVDAKKWWDEKKKINEL